MPRNEYSCNFAVMSDFDARPYTSAIYTRTNSSGVSTPYTLPTESQIVFDDPIAFLNGNGVDTLHSPKTALEKVFTGETWSVSINNLDHISLIRNNAQSVDVYPTSSSPTLYGTETTLTTYPTGQIIFNHDWRRGYRFIEGSNSVFQVAGTFPKLINLPHLDIIQSLPSYFNTRQGNNQYCLEWSENRFYTGTNIIRPAVQWVIDDDGHVIQLVDTTLNQYAKTFSWSDTDFRDRLGYNGLESWVQHPYRTTSWYLKANNPMPGVLIPTRPLSNQFIRIDRPSDSKRLFGTGRYATNFIQSYVYTNFSFYLDAYADSKNDYRHYTDTCGNYFYKGARVSLYQDWGDTRLSIKDVDINSSQPAYNALYTSENNGSFGIIRGTLVDYSNSLSFPGEIRRRVPITMEIQND